MTPLQTELAYFQANREGYLKLYPDKFVLIRGEELVGAYDDFSAAYQEGVNRFGMQPFLIRQVTATDLPASMPALYTGLVGLSG